MVITSRRCYICGKEGGDIFCKKCYKFICAACYDEEKDLCTKCSGCSNLYIRIVKNPKFLIAGLALIVLGIMAMTYSILPEEEPYIFMFPFIFSKVNTKTAFMLTFLFYGMFTLSSLILLYLARRRSRSWDWGEEVYTIKGTTIQGSKDPKEYFITTEIPRKLQDSVFIEDEIDRVVLLSKRDKNFVRVYNLPDSYSVDSVESDYEGNFLLVKIQLRREY